MTNINRLRGLLLACATVTLATNTVDAQGSHTAETQAVRARLLTRIAQVPGAEVAVVIRDLGGERSLSLNGDTVFHAASTMKVPVLFALFREFEAGRLAADQQVLLVNRFQSIADGSPFTLDPADDSDSSVYAHIGQRMSLQELATRMITHSSNLATNAVIALLEPARITQLTRELGATRIMVRRGVEDNAAFRAGLNNTTTADDLSVLLEALERGKVAGPKSTATMRDILLAQHFKDGIPAGLPPGTVVAHKTGSITATWHDTGIVYPPGRKPFVVTVLTRGIPDEAVGQRLIADCARIAWEWVVEGRTQ